MTTLNLYSKDQVDALLPDSDELVPDTTGASQGDVLTVGASGTEWVTPSTSSPVTYTFNTIPEFMFYLAHAKPSDTFVIEGILYHYSSTNYVFDGRMKGVIASKDSNYIYTVCNIEAISKIKHQSVTSGSYSYEIMNCYITGHPRDNGNTSNFLIWFRIGSQYSSITVVDSSLAYNNSDTISGVITSIDGSMPQYTSS